MTKPVYFLNGIHPNHNIRVPFEFRQPWAMICFVIVIFVIKIGHVSGSKKFYRGCVGEMTRPTEGIVVVSYIHY